jgi:mannose-6-phosphate isomerase-like protein (cupin superfamily)
MQILFPRECRRAFLFVVASALASNAQSVRVLRYADGKPYQMGNVTSRRIVHPDMGAKRLTLNYSISQPGAEFSQHVHDHSDDTILVLAGQAVLRQGDSRTPIEAGKCAFVPAGQIHGTVTTGTGETTMISWQTPPDLVLYTGARDSSKPGAAPPKGVITPGAVKYVDFAKQNGFFTNADVGAKRSVGAHWVLERGKALSAKVPPGGEQLVFVWKGSIRVKHGADTLTAGEKDTVFISGPAEVEVTGDSNVPAEVIQVQGPPPNPAR